MSTCASGRRSCTAPPLAVVRSIPRELARRMVPSSAQLPFMPPSILQSPRRPPVRSNRQSWSWAKNAIDCPSGDQNGAAAPSVPGRATAVSESRRRSQRCDSPCGESSTNAKRCPSGESAPKLDRSLNSCPSGGSSDDTTSGAVPRSASTQRHGESRECDRRHERRDAPRQPALPA